jgi:predicted nucleic acid-binding protein
MNYVKKISLTPPASLQVLGEVFNALTKKGLKEKEEARQMILDLV